MFNKILAYIVKAIVGAILGVFSVGIILGVIYGPQMWIGVTSALIGVVAYYAYLLYKGETD